MVQVIKFTAHFKRNRRGAIHMWKAIQTDQSIWKNRSYNSRPLVVKGVALYWCGYIVKNTFHLKYRRSRLFSSGTILQIKLSCYSVHHFELVMATSFQLFNQLPFYLQFAQFAKFTEKEQLTLIAEKKCRNWFTFNLIVHFRWLKCWVYRP